MHRHCTQTPCRLLGRVARTVLFSLCQPKAKAQSKQARRERGGGDNWARAGTRRTCRWSAQLSLHGGRRGTGDGLRFQRPWLPASQCSHKSKVTVAGVCRRVGVTHHITHGNVIDFQIKKPHRNALQERLPAAEYTSLISKCSSRTIDGSSTHR